MSLQTRLIERLVKTLKDQGQVVIIRETHISWVLLFGDRAWKIKKSVDFGFLDFSTLSKRKYACEEEIRLNRRFAPQLYLRVLTIGGTADHPDLTGDSKPIEYAVVMQRFDESCLLSNLAEHGQLTSVIIDNIATGVAKMHQNAPVVPLNSSWGEAEQVYRWLSESLQHISKLVRSATDQHQIQRIEQHCIKLYRQIKPALQTRNKNGFIRECHGDLHLGNMIWLQQQLQPFDCIEFNPALRWIDVMSEAAFVMMDLLDRGYPDFAWRFINHYLTVTGDYAGLCVLHYYIVYRALVRAKVAVLQEHEDDTPADVQTALRKQYVNYVDLAGQWLTQYRPALMITHGLSASGKSTVSSTLSEQYGCIHIRSDVERKRLHGLSALADSGAALASGIYSPSSTEHTYRHLYDLAQRLISAGYPVIVDAAFLERGQREHFQQLAITMNCPFLIVHCEADNTVLESRIKARTQTGNDPSEANVEVLKRQLDTQDVLSHDEVFITVGNKTSARIPAFILDVLDS